MINLYCLDRAATHSYATMIELLDMPIDDTDAMIIGCEGVTRAVVMSDLLKLAEHKRWDGIHAFIAPPDLYRSLVFQMQQNTYVPVIDGMIVPSNHVPDDTILLVHIKQGKVTCLAKLIGVLS